VVVRRHPIAFASKRTSEIEERYAPHLLEFAALKFSLDKFSNIVWGQPIKLKTDCSALRDVLMNDKATVAHERWRNGVLRYNIVSAEHIKGVDNTAADLISRKFEGVEKEAGDGHEWTVSPDWEANEGIVDDMFSVVVAGAEEEGVYLVASLPVGTMALRERFKDEAMYVEVLDAIFELDVGKTMKARRKAKHRAMGYFVEGGKLWKLGGGSPARAKAKRECVTRAEATEMAAKIHAERGHFHRDAVKLILLDSIESPRLDESILRAISNCGQCNLPTYTHAWTPSYAGTHSSSLSATTSPCPMGRAGTT
jgi:hypothetical protein